MQKKVEEIEAELSTRIYKLFLVRFDGNKSAFARASNCHEKTIRRIFNNQQGLTVNLLFKFCYALKIEPSELIKDLHVIIEN